MQGMKDRNTSSSALQMRTREQPSWRKGLNAENLPSPPSQGKNILLTFPFIEPAYSASSPGTEVFTVCRYPSCISHLPEFDSATR
jgi:hypothetical protein